MIQIVRVLNYYWGLCTSMSQSIENWSYGLFTVATFGLHKNNLLKLMRHCKSKRVYFYPDADTFYNLLICREKHTKYTHNDGQKGIIEDLEEDIVWTYFTWTWSSLHLLSVSI